MYTFTGTFAPGLKHHGGSQKAGDLAAKTPSVIINLYQHVKHVRHKYG